MFAFYHLSAVITIKKSSSGLYGSSTCASLPPSLCTVHNFYSLFFIYLEILTIFLHIVHILFIFGKYNKYIESKAKCRVTITHIDKFFHNSPGAERCLGTPHFVVFFSLPRCAGRFQACSIFQLSASAYTHRKRTVLVLFLLSDTLNSFCFHLTDM